MIDCYLGDSHIRLAGGATFNIVLFYVYSYLSHRTIVSGLCWVVFTLLRHNSLVGDVPRKNARDRFVQRIVVAACLLPACPTSASCWFPLHSHRNAQFIFTGWLLTLPPPFT